MITALNAINLAHTLHGKMSTFDHSMLAKIAKYDSTFIARSNNKGSSLSAFESMRGPVKVHFMAFFSCLYNDLMNGEEALMLEEGST